MISIRKSIDILIAFIETVVTDFPPFEYIISLSIGFGRTPKLRDLT